MDITKQRETSRLLSHKPMVRDGPEPLFQPCDSQSGEDVPFMLSGLDVPCPAP